MSSDFGGIPSGHVQPVDAVLRVAVGRSLTPVWQNYFGGCTFQIGSGASREFSSERRPEAGWTWSRRPNG